jgi:hypothetical protein
MRNREGPSSWPPIKLPFGCFVGCSASALGQKQTFASQKAMSAFDPKADTNSVRHGPSMIALGRLRTKICLLQTPRQIGFVRRGLKYNFPLGECIDSIRDSQRLLDELLNE